VSACPTSATAQQHSRSVSGAELLDPNPLVRFQRVHLLGNTSMVRIRLHQSDTSYYLLVRRTCTRVMELAFGGARDAVPSRLPSHAAENRMLPFREAFAFIVSSRLVGGATSRQAH